MANLTDVWQSEAPRSFLSWTWIRVCRPRVRSVLVGIVLIALGATALSSSVWTLPLVIVGIAMIVVAWVGARLEGRFVVDWGEHGTGFQLSARIKPSPPPEHHPVRSELARPPASQAHEGRAVPAVRGAIPALVLAGEAHQRQAGATTQQRQNGASAPVPSAPARAAA